MSRQVQCSLVGAAMIAAVMFVARSAGVLIVDTALVLMAAVL